MNKLQWIQLGLTVTALILLAILFFRKPEVQNYGTMQKIIQEEISKIPKDSLIIEKYYTIREITKTQLTEFEHADSLKRDSLFWVYYNNWKAETNE